MYAILSSIQSFRLAFYSHYATERYYREGADREYTLLLERLALNLPIWRSVLALLHTCDASRKTTLQTYRLDLESVIQAENELLWAPADMIYFALEPTPNCDAELALTNTEEPLDQASFPCNM
jgi:hypothetical protein